MKLKSITIAIRAAAVLAGVAGGSFAVLLAVAPTPAPTPGAPSAGNAAVTSQLIARPWGFLGSWWYAVRVFAPDGTFTTIHGGEKGTWTISGTSVDLNFGNHVDRIKLPLDPAGCTGYDAGGVPLLVHGCKPLPTPKAAVPKPTSALDFLRQTPTPGPADIARQSATYGKLLVSTRWKFTGPGWSVVRIFASDGTFTTDAHPLEYGKWKIASGEIALTYTNDGHIESLDLPLDPKGTEGSEPGGAPILAVVYVPPAPAPVAAIAPATQPAVAPASPPKGDPATIAMLVSKPWKWLGSGWFAVRVLAADGTFITQGGDERGTWALEQDKVALTFADGHEDTMQLPAKPGEGTTGVDGKGGAVTILPGKPSLPATAAPSPAPAQQSADTDTILEAAPWKITGGWWSMIRIFAKDGTFTTVGQANEFGSWKIVNGCIALTFPDGHNDTLQLPLDPNGTDGGDREGRPVYAVREPVTGAVPTPAPTPGKTAQQPTGPTPPPFGTAHPPETVSTPPPGPQHPITNPFGTSVPPAQ